MTFARPPPPKALFQSDPISDRDSVFIAHVFRVSSPHEVRSAVTELSKVMHASKPATHEMYAFRTMTLREGRDGLLGPEDFELRTGADDDGEKYGSTKILKVMEAEGIIDAVVVCSRWYGGTMLGPARFSHIETCTRQVCQWFKALEQVEGFVAELESLDKEIVNLRTQLSLLNDNTNTNVSTTKKQDYKTLLVDPRPPDVAKAQRLIQARHGTIRSLTKIIQRYSSS